MKTGRLLSLFLISVLLLATPARSEASPVIIKLLPTAATSLVSSLLGGTIIDSIPGTNILLVDLPTIPIVTPLLRLLGLEWVEPNAGILLGPVGTLGRVATTSAPDWYKYQPALQLVRAPQAQTYSTGLSVVVADINSQVDYSHPALIGHLTSGYDFVESRPASSASLNQSSAGFLDQSSAGFLDQSSAGFLDQSSAGFLDENGFNALNQSSAGFLDGRNPAYSHGTLCAGIIAAVAPNAMIMPLRAFDDEGGTDLFTLAKAVRYATTNGAQVINMSFGTLTNSKALKDSVDFALGRNVVLVASAGNNNTSNPQFPAAYTGVITTAATDLADKKGSFSNYGSSIVVDAPGVNIISAYPGNLYSVVSGTSFSAPVVAGTAALVRSIRASGVSNAMTGSAVNINLMNPAYIGKLGYGRIDALKAVHP